ncbi:3-hydroxyacyl-ACP dehydratase, partial [Streptomyces boncukensis]
PRPLARTKVDRLTAAELDALGAGDVAAVFGPAYDQRGLAPHELPARWQTRLLREVTAVEPRGGRYAQGLLRATALPAAEPGGGDWPRLVALAAELLRVHAFHQGLHLCVPGARAAPVTDRPVRTGFPGAPAPGTGGPEPEPDAELVLELEVTEQGLAPRPYVIGDCRFTRSGREVARVRDAGVVLREGPGTGLEIGLDRPSCRKGPSGERVPGSELHLALVAEGEAGVRIHGVPEVRVTARTRPRLPRGDLLMVDRCTGGHGGAWREYRPGSALSSAYDVPDDPWYLRENAGALPQLALLEMALQPMGAFGWLLGAQGEYPDQSLVCRNLEGSARLLRDVELRGATVEQRAVLTAHTPLPGGLLHRGDLSLSTGGEPFCEVSAVTGYVTSELLERQRGMDGGRCLPPWLDRCPQPPDRVRRLDLREDTRLGHGRLALLEEVALVPGGGDHGAGYALCDKPVRADDWFFAQHFLHDPVMPGSAGVQMLYQAVHAYALYTGLVAHLPRPRFALAAGEELRWTYRGQILPEHRWVRGEVQLREARRAADGSVLLLADGSVWRDGLRIYQVDNIALRATPGAPGGAEAQR